MPALRGLRAAIAVLTRVPIGGFPYSDAEWRWSGAHMPIVGALLGAVLGGVWLAAGRAGHLVAAAIVVAASLVLTGAMHEDGLADTADALGGGTTPERVLAILKDSRIGAFGAAALVMTLLVRVLLLARLADAAPFALVLSGTLSRLGPVGLMATLPYVTDVSVAKSRSVTAAGGAQLAIACVWTAGIVWLLYATNVVASLELVAAVASTVAIASACGVRFAARVSGITGDFLGATQQLIECAVLLALAISRGGPG